MDLTLFIVFVIMIISFFYFIKQLSSLQFEIKSLKSSCSKCFIPQSSSQPLPPVIPKLPLSIQAPVIPNNKEIVNKIKEVFLNYIRK